MKFWSLPRKNKLICFFIPESKHCPPSCDTRELLSRPPKCQTRIFLDLFDSKFKDDLDLPSCKCCYNCISSHSSKCQDCQLFLERFFPRVSVVKVGRSVAAEIKEALSELFQAMELVNVKIENNLQISCQSLINDVLRMVDEIKKPEDIVKIWHIDIQLAVKVFSVLFDVLFGSDEDSFDDQTTLEQEDSDSDTDDECDEDSDVLDPSTSSDDDV